MSDIEVYRVERVNGDGMYRPADPEDFECPFHDMIWRWRSAKSLDLAPSDFADIHVIPSKDPKINEVFDGPSMHLYYFGFSSAKQLNDWIFVPEWKEMLAERGFFVSTYSVRDLPRSVVFGDHQVIFMKHCSKLIARSELTSFW